MTWLIQLVVALASLLLLYHGSDTYAVSHDGLKNSIGPIRKHWLHPTVVASYFFTQACFPSEAWSKPSPIPIDNIYSSDSPRFSFKYSSDLRLSPKLLKTHNMEVFLQSQEYKGFNVGITVSLPACSLA